MGVFEDIPIRSNGDTDDVDASWFNVIRTALVSTFGGGVSGETKFTLTDNQSSLADITDLTLDGTSFGKIVVKYSIYRYDGSSAERREGGTLTFLYKPQAGVWTMNRRSEGDDALNMGADSLDVTTTSEVGQVKYKTDNMGGADHYFTWGITETKAIEV